VLVLRDVNLEVKRAEFFALLGPNGSGKTTLLNVVLGLIVPDSGMVRVFGRDPNDRKWNVLRRVNFLPALRNQLLQFTVKETLMSYAKLYGAPESRVDEVIESFDLTRLARRKWWMLSTGEQHRVTLAKALVNQPELLLLDEPTMGLDPKITREVRSKLLDFYKRGVTIFFATQNMAEASELASTVAFIKNGQVLDVRETSDVIESYGGLEEYWFELEGR